MIGTSISWVELKQFIDDTSLYNFMNFLRLTTNDCYVWVSYQGMTFYVLLNYGSADHEDFKTSYLPKIILKDDISSDGLQKTKSSKVTAGRYMQQIFVQFSLGKKQIKDKTGDFSIKLFDQNGAITEDESVAVKTTVTFAPTYSYELLAGQIQTLEDITTDIYLCCMLVPKDDDEYYSNIMNRKIIAPRDNFEVIGTGTMDLVYNEAFEVQMNTIAATFRHAAGSHFEFQVSVKIYK